MEELFEFLKSNSQMFDIIIISDSNECFIKWILEAKGFYDCIIGVFTNPATIDKDDCLRIKPYHAHDCKECPMNMCK